MVITVLEHLSRQKGPTHAQPDAATETGLCRLVHPLVDPRLPSHLAPVDVHVASLSLGQAAPAAEATRTSDLRPFQKTKSTAGLIVARVAVTAAPAPLGAQVPADTLTSVPAGTVHQPNALAPLCVATHLLLRTIRCPTPKALPHRLVNDYELPIGCLFPQQTYGYAAFVAAFILLVDSPSLRRKIQFKVSFLAWRPLEMQSIQ